MEKPGFCHTGNPDFSMINFGSGQQADEETAPGRGGQPPAGAEWPGPASGGSVGQRVLRRRRASSTSGSPSWLSQVSSSG